MSTRMMIRVMLLVVLISAAATWLRAHEGHRALPVGGVLVDLAGGTVALAPAPRAALDVQTAEVTSEPVEVRITAPVTIESPWQHHVFATSRTPGRIRSLRVQPGEPVVPGQVLAEVESLDLEALQLELLAVRNETRLSRTNLQALEVASRDGSVSDQVLRDYRVKQRGDENALEIARRKLLVQGVAETEVARLLTDNEPAPLRVVPVRSPIAGTVLHVDARIGQMIEPTDHVAEIIDTRSLYAVAAVLEKDLRRVAVGQPVEIRLAADPEPEHVLRSTVRSTGLALDPKTHQAPVIAGLADSPRVPPLLPGMIGEASLIVAKSVQSLTVPEEALVQDGAETYVLVEQGPGQYLRRNVVPGSSTAGRVEVRSSQLYPGDRVVTVGRFELGSLLVQGTFRLSPEALASAGVKVEPIRRRPIAHVEDLGAVVELPIDRRSILSSPLSGTVYRIRVDRDQAVRAGDVVAEVASADFQNLQLDLLRNHLEWKLLEESLASLRSLAGTLPGRQLRETEVQVTAARQRRDSARRKLESVGLSAEAVQRVLEKGEFAPALPVRAAISGNVVRFHGVLGQAVKAEEPLFEIHDLSTAVLHGFVPERQLKAVRAGQRGRVRLTADPDFVSEVVVDRVSQALGGDGRVLSLWSKLDKLPEGLLRDGLLARLALQTGEPASALAIPGEAVLREGTHGYVFRRRDDGSFERREVRIGRHDDRYMEIVSGLQEGDPVAIAGVAGLQNAFATVK